MTNDRISSLPLSEVDTDGKGQTSHDGKSNGVGKDQRTTGIMKRIPPLEMRLSLQLYRLRYLPATRGHR